MKVQIAFELEKETKGALRYKEAGEDDPSKYMVGTIYIRKHAVSLPYPTLLNVTIEAFHDQPEETA